MVFTLTVTLPPETVSSLGESRIEHYVLLKRPKYRFACSAAGGSFLSKNHFFFFCRAESDSGSTISIGIPGTEYVYMRAGGGTISVAFCLFGCVPASHVQRGREGGVVFRPPPPPRSEDSTSWGPGADESDGRGVCWVWEASSSWVAVRGKGSVVPGHWNVIGGERGFLAGTGE